MGNWSTVRRVLVLIFALALFAVVPGALADAPDVDNGGFETPVVMDALGWDIFADGDTGVEWKVSWFEGSTSWNGHVRPLEAQLEFHQGVNGWEAREGEQYVELDTDWTGPGGYNGEPASVKIEQKFDVIEGCEYDVGYSWSPRPGHDDNQMDVRLTNLGVNSVKIGDHDGVGGSQTSWTDETYTYTATSDRSLLLFKEVGTPDSLGMFLDAVSVTQTGEGDVYVPMSFPLYAGQDIEVGTINVSYDGTELTIEFALKAPWVMSESHLHVAATKDGIPQTKKGNPIPGQFEFGDDYVPPVSSDTFNVPWLPADGLTPVIAAHAKVLEMDYDGPFWASDVVSNSFGYRTAVDNVFRLEPESATGLFEPDGEFYSLGLSGMWPYYPSGDGSLPYDPALEDQEFVGEITVAFDGWVFNGEGYDISVHEITGNRPSYPEETAEVFGWYDAEWVPLGSVSNKDNGSGIALIDLDDAGLPYVEKVKIVDTTPVENYGTHTFDGYDLDAVDAQVLYYGDESAWGADGTCEFDGKNWATCMVYTIDNLCEIDS